MDYKQELDFYRREYFRILDFVPVGIVVAHPLISKVSKDQDILLKIDYVIIL